mmetsp:Transcript_12796/g.40424  ORF Transcript_12796/g.40424 Transcript_12796/m.40424 type:complete len:200 (+) Transcript_12796:1141-1740(+)
MFSPHRLPRKPGEDVATCSIDEPCHLWNLHQGDRLTASPKLSHAPRTLRRVAQRRLLAQRHEGSPSHWLHHVCAGRVNLVVEGKAVLGGERRQGGRRHGSPSSRLEEQQLVPLAKECDRPVRQPCVKQRMCNLKVGQTGDQRAYVDEGDRTRPHNLSEKCRHRPAGIQCELVDDLSVGQRRQNVALGDRVKRAWAQRAR